MKRTVARNKSFGVCAIEEVLQRDHSLCLSELLYCSILRMPGCSVFNQVGATTAISAMARCMQLHTLIAVVQLTSCVIALSLFGAHADFRVEFV